MKNLFLIAGFSFLLTSLVGCSNSPDNNTDNSGHAFDSSNTMYDDGISIYNNTNRDTLSSDSLIPPTPMN